MKIKMKLIMVCNKTNLPLLSYMLTVKYRLIAQTINHAVVLYVMYDHFTAQHKKGVLFKQFEKICSYESPV